MALSPLREVELPVFPIRHFTIKTIFTMSVRTAVNAFLLSVSVAALNPSCAPGGNFDMSKWNLQLPVGSPGSPTTITASRLQGCSGHQDQFFFTEAGNGALVMMVPGSSSSSGCVTTPNSLHCRTELREISPSSWDRMGRRTDCMSP